MISESTPIREDPKYNLPDSPNFIDISEFNRAKGLNRDQSILEPQRAFNFKSIPADIAYRLECEKWGEVFKFHPVLKVSLTLSLPSQR